MIEVRIHGRGGQGSVIASQILAEAAFRGGMHVQAFPSFGSERRGAPVTAFLRIDRAPIMVRSKVYEPDGVVILDQALLGLHSSNILSGLRPGGWILINSPMAPEEFSEFSPFEICTIDAASVSRKFRLGTPTAPIVNTVMAGALVAFKGISSPDHLEQAIRHAVPVKPEENASAALEGARLIRIRESREQLGTENVSE